MKLNKIEQADSYKKNIKMQDKIEVKVDYGSLLSLIKCSIQKMIF